MAVRQLRQAGGQIIWSWERQFIVVETSQLVTRWTRHTLKSCDELTVVSDGVVTSWPHFLTFQ